MDLHSSYPALLPFITIYPRLSGCLFPVYNDLRHAQRWEELEIHALPNCSRIVLKGRRPETKASQAVVPCYLAESLSLDWLSSIFRELNDVSAIHVAIVSDDSSIVYYSLSKGIVKPPS